MKTTALLLCLTACTHLRAAPLAPPVQDDDLSRVAVERAKLDDNADQIARANGTVLWIRREATFVAAATTAIDILGGHVRRILRDYEEGRLLLNAVDDAQTARGELGVAADHVERAELEVQRALTNVRIAEQLRFGATRGDLSSPAVSLAKPRVGRGALDEALLRRLRRDQLEALDVPRFPDSLAPALYDAALSRLDLALEHRREAVYAFDAAQAEIVYALDRAVAIEEGPLGRSAREQYLRLAHAQRAVLELIAQRMDLLEGDGPLGVALDVLDDQQINRGPVSWVFIGRTAKARAISDALRQRDRDVEETRKLLDTVASGQAADVIDAQLEVLEVAAGGSGNLPVIPL